MLLAAPAAEASCTRVKAMQALKFAGIPSGSATLVYIAQERGFFAANGLEVTVKDFPTGVATTEALIKNEVDVAWAAELPLVRRAFDGEKISAFAVTSRFSDQFLYGLKSHGINGIADLKGKRVGVPRNTIAEFYLVRFLELNGLHAEDVAMENVLPPQSIEALGAGAVDAVVTWDPFSTQLKQKMADAVTAWSVQNKQPGFGIVMGRNDWLETQRDTVVRFLKSLVKAEEFLVHNPEAARAIVKAKLGFDDALMDVTFRYTEFSIFLDQAFILAMEDEARWLIGSNQTQAKKVPDFLEYVSEGALKKVKPGAVNVIR